MFADYRVPAVLREMDILQYSPGLAEQVRHFLPIQAQQQALYTCSKSLRENSHWPTSHLGMRRCTACNLEISHVMRTVRCCITESECNMHA